LHAANVLLIVTPSGLWMALYASTGTIAGIGFAIQAVVTATCIAFGWRAAIKRQFAVHRRWMWRSFLLLAAAVVLRILGGLGTVLEVQATWFDPLASWASWLVPVTAFEVVSLTTWRSSRWLPQPAAPQPAR
jgi:hypothetical protein